jgi:glycosyltransferase involved in cell wall biosynthesis
VRVVSWPPTPFIGLSSGAPRSFGILSSFPPTACGLATFSAALAAGLAAHGAEVGIVRVVDADGADGSDGSTDSVVGELVNGSARSVSASAELLNRFDVAVVQHEYGLFGGTDGDEVVEILAGLRVPSVVIAHTILSDPTAHQSSVLNDVAALADLVVVMSEAARERLCSRFEVDPAKVVTIPHGAAVPEHRPSTNRSRRPTLLTWGLIGPGKGIERAIDAMPMLHDLPMRPRYLVAGQTHPKVLATQGESYRRARMDQATRLGVAGSVVFDSSYRDLASLTALIQSSAVVVLPYDSTEQATSGVLVDAIAAGRPVVATAFPHAVELLSSGAGLVVEHDDPSAMARGLHRVLTEPWLAQRMAGEARRLAPSLGWPVVAGQYLKLADRLVAAQPALV